MKYRTRISLISLVSLINLVNSSSLKESLKFDDKICQTLPQFTPQLQQQIQMMSAEVNQIIDFVFKDQRGETYQELATFVDKFGARHLGTDALENSIDYMTNLLTKERHDIVQTEPLSVPIWTRGKEWAEMVSPRVKPMNILGLGYSVGTSGGVLTGDVIVVRSWHDLDRRASEVKGKFVVYNYVWEDYSTSALYRKNGASEAAKHGAIGALIRSATPFSIDSPHTGMQNYTDENVTKIPAVSITVEDAELFDRIAARGENVKVSLYMEAHMNGTGVSRNTISELTGTTHPDEVVIVSGHIDSWDVGQGAMDDAGGAFISWRALSVLKRLGLRPKRTIRSILWTGEEMGYFGAKAYAKQHQNEMHKISLAMESDEGTFTPFGLTYSSTNPVGQCIFQEVLNLMGRLNATNLNPVSHGPDIDFLMSLGVPGAHLDTENDRYFWYHHTNGDTMSMENADDLDKCTALFAATAYAIANLDHMLPR